MFILESLGGKYAIDVSGRLEPKDFCKPKKFRTENDAKEWAKHCGIRTRCCQSMNVKQMAVKESDCDE